VREEGLLPLPQGGRPQSREHGGCCAQGDLPLRSLYRIWAYAEPIRKIFRRAFADAGLPYFNPHSFRDTVVQLGKRLCQTPEEFEAWSKNLGHEHMLTTFRSYGSIDPHRQGELIKSIGGERGGESKIDQLIEMVRGLER
jgi:hypothetical protein